jgi:nucleotide-binding universal stress UspA family protein
MGPSSVRSPAEEDQRAEQELREVLAAELGDGAGAVEVEVARGRAGDVLLASAARADTDMVVLGARGLGGFDGMLLGSVTQQVVERATRPVVVIRGEPADAAIPPKEVLVAVDGSAGSAEALGWAVSVAEATDGEIIAVHAPGVAVSNAQHEEAEQALEQWTAPLRERGVRHRTHVGDGDARTVIVQVAEDQDADLVVVGTRGLGGLRALVLGSVAAHLVRTATRPIAVVPGSDRR